ncbi:uncharacterized protein LOC107766624 [Nicotiana tabacum]|uniref:Uncharacterized protein LOC107766624 n=1 Tax=Nicotiana tabacum TaxID=4097 RepID=A0A1S3XM60_TOBAC|nr:PREDICTED: uncharacterized protein LOC107766624 [Nicotiana tabacum]
MKQLGGVEFGVTVFYPMHHDICFRVPKNIEDPHLDKFFMEFECGLLKEHALVHKTMFTSLSIVFDPGGVNTCLCATSEQLLFSLMKDLTTETYDTPQQYIKTHAAVAALAAMLQKWVVLELRSGSKVKLRAIQGAGYTFSGVIEVVELVACHRLHHGLGDAFIYGILLNKYRIAGQVITKLNLIMLKSSTINRKDHGCSWLIAGAIERFSVERASKTIYQFFKETNSSFDGFEHVKEWAQEIMVIGLVMHTCIVVTFVNTSSVANSGVNNMTMIIVGKSNIFLVRDENGTDKTETATMFMPYLAYFGGHRTIERWDVEKLVLESYPVLDAHSSVKTIRNTKSIHQSKIVEQFVQNGRPTSVATKEEIKRCHLGDPKLFNYLNHFKFYEILAVRDGWDIFETRMAMKIIGIIKQEQEEIIRVVAFVLHLATSDTHSSLAIMISMLICSNLEDNVLIEVGSIVMNRPQLYMDTNKNVTQIDTRPRRSNWAKPSQRLIWDPG